MTQERIRQQTLALLAESIAANRHSDGQRCQWLRGKKKLLGTWAAVRESYPEAMKAARGGALRRRRQIERFDRVYEAYQKADRQEGEGLYAEGGRGVYAGGVGGADSTAAIPETPCSTWNAGQRISPSALIETARRVRMMRGRSSPGSVDVGGEGVEP